MMNFRPVCATLSVAEWENHRQRLQSPSLGRGGNRWQSHEVTENKMIPMHTEEPLGFTGDLNESHQIPLYTLAW